MRDAYGRRFDRSVHLTNIVQCGTPRSNPKSHSQKARPCVGNPFWISSPSDELIPETEGWLKGGRRRGVRSEWRWRLVDWLANELFLDRGDDVDLWSED